MNFTLGNSNVTGPANYLQTLITAVCMNVTVVILCITIDYINGVMVQTFHNHQTFRLNARYILFIHLVYNDMIQLTTSISLFIVFYVFNTIYVFLCIPLILTAVLTTLNTPLNLAFMAAECYIAVCIPLRYNYICTVKRTYMVIGVIWTISSLSLLPDVFILLATEPLEFFNSKVLCSRDYVFRNPYSLKKRDASHILFLVVVWLTLFYTYFRILFAATAAKADTTKAKKTILLHGFQVLLCMMIYVQPILNQVLSYLFSGELKSMNFFMFIIIQVFPRLVSPIVYGLRDKTFRKYFKLYLLCTASKKLHRTHKIPL